MKDRQSNTSISIFGCITMYEKLITQGKIRPDGAAVKRLKLLQDRYYKGERFFKKQRFPV